jgi:hypothetical protein
MVNNGSKIDDAVRNQQHEALREIEPRYLSMWYGITFLCSRFLHRCGLLILYTKILWIVILQPGCIST